MSKVKNQHFVPQSYLKRFSVNDQLFVYDKVINKTFELSHLPMRLAINAASETDKKYIEKYLASLKIISFVK